jgi:thioredoxin-like negative regulator of GroEL
VPRLCHPCYIDVGYCLSLVEQDRHGVGEWARQVMVNIFRVLPAGSELVHDYRRNLAMLLC